MADLGPIRGILLSSEFSGGQDALMKRAIKNGVRAIETVGANALNSFRPTDVSLAAQVFFGQITVSAQDITRGRLVSAAATVAALRYMDQLFLKPAFIEPGRSTDSPFLIFCAVLHGVPHFWRVFRSWLLLMLERCLREPESHKELIGLIDRVFKTLCPVAKALYPPFLPDRELLVLLTRIWVTDVDRNQLAISIPFLVSGGLFSVAEFLSAFGGSTEELVVTCKHHLELAHNHLLGKKEQAYRATFHNTDLLISLIRNDNSLRAQIVTHDMIPLFTRILETVTNDVQSPASSDHSRRGNHPDEKAAAVTADRPCSRRVRDCLLELGPI